MCMIVNPNFTFRPSNNGSSSIRDYTSVFSNKNEFSFKNIVINIVINAISAIVWINSTHSFRLGYRFSFVIQNMATIF